MEVVRLSSAETAARLGVKPESLYAYVSRGLLTRQRDAGGSTFDPLEVEAFARGRRASPRPTAAGAPAGRPLGVLDTDVALIDEDELRFRGRSAAELARGSDLESVAAWLWGMTDAATLRRIGADPRAVTAARAVLDALPVEATPLDRMQAVVVVLAAADPLRRDVSAEALARAGARMLCGIPAALIAGAPAPGADLPGDVAGALWTALCGQVPTPAEHRAVSAALVLAVDHDLAVSTFAGRVAASSRGSGYAVVTAALGAFDGPLHGTASHACAALVRRVRDGEPVAHALAAAVRDGGRGVPGFGHPLYSGTDPRAATLLPLVASIDTADATIAAVEEVAAEVQRRTGLAPNVDLALGALVVAGGLPDDGGAMLFAVGRLVGWIAHAVAEYGEEPLRLRPVGRYVGP